MPSGLGRRRIAVVGAGISGLSAAWGLRERHAVTLYEAAPRLGGHSATVDVQVDGRTIPVDTGFIVYNTLNYPNLTALFTHLGVATEASNMSFSVSLDRGRREWAGHERQLWRLFAQPTNIFDPGFMGMLRDVMRFNRQSVRDLRAGSLTGLSLGDYLTLGKYGVRFRSDYLVPMGAAIWSTAAARMLDFPAETFVQFFDNHRLLGFDRPQWRTVSGGSRVYVERIARDLVGSIRLASPVTRIARREREVIVSSAGDDTAYDDVVIATHSDQALRMLADPSRAESEILGAIRFQDNDVWLHRDPSLMPKRRSAWSAWNYLASSTADAATSQHVSLTYWMNVLQNIDRAAPLFVSLNPPRPPREEMVFGRFSYAHPQLDGPALGAQRRLDTIQGANRAWFCGAWTGFGFHEDGLSASIRVAEALGGAFPWRPSPHAGQTAQEAAA